MNKSLATRFMKIVEEVLNFSPEDSIFKNNINPLRVGLMLYRVVDEVQTLYHYSINSTNLMKEKLSSQM